MKKLIKNLLFRILYYSHALELLRFMNRNKAIILVYHGVTKSRYCDMIKNSAYLHIDSDNFKRYINYIKKRYNIISLEQLCDILEKKMAIPKHSIIITFDDGYRNIFENAYLFLRENKITFSIFLTDKLMRNDDWLWTDKLEYAVDITNAKSINIFDGAYELISRRLKRKFIFFVRNRLKGLNDEDRDKAMQDLILRLGVNIPKHPLEDYRLMSYEQARQMNSLFVSFGSHTPEHTILPLESKERIQSLLRESKSAISGELNNNTTLFSYPNGSYNDWIKLILKDSGFRCGLTTNYGINDEHADIFELKRISVSSDDSLISFIAKISGIKKFIP